MKPEEVGEFEKSFRKLVIVFPAKVQPNEETMAVWIEALADKEIRHIASAVKSFIRGIDDEPTPGKIREIAADHYVDEYNRRPRIEPPKPDPTRPFADRETESLRDSIDWSRGKEAAGHETTAKEKADRELREAELERRGLNHQTDPKSSLFAQGVAFARKAIAESSSKPMAPQTSSEVAS